MNPILRALHSPFANAIDARNELNPPGPAATATTPTCSSSAPIAALTFGSRCIECLLPASHVRDAKMSAPSNNAALEVGIDVSSASVSFRASSIGPWSRKRFQIGFQGGVGSGPGAFEFDFPLIAPNMYQRDRYTVAAP